jgi:hypothetical protein
MKASSQVSLYAKGVWQLGIIAPQSANFKELMAVAAIVDNAIERARKV